MEAQRLDKIIASTGRFSRREVKLLARQGRILVDGRPIRDTAEKADPETAEITVDGRTVALEAGDSVRFRADVPHGYRNPGEETAELSMLIYYGK